MSSAHNQPQKISVLRSSVWVSLVTFASRILGLIRDMVFAWFIGASGGADAFFVAFKIPNFLRRLFAEGAFSQAFVPILSEFRQRGDAQAVKDLIDRIAGCLAVSVIAVSVLAVLAAPALTWLFAPGFYLHSPEKFAITVDLIRITFPYLALISLAGFAGAILNSYDRYAIPAFTPITLNLVLIVAAVWVSPYFDIPSMALAWGVLVAGVCQLTLQLPFLMRMNLMPNPKVDWKNPVVKRVLMLMAPAMFGVSVSQINLLLDTVLASLINDGSVSWLYYSDRLIELPLGVFGIAIATVILPVLSRQHTAQSQTFSHTLDWSIRTLLLISMPATLALFVLAEPIIITLFQHGTKFTAFDAKMASYSLMAYTFGLTAFMLIKVLANGYFARQDVKTPVKIGIIAMIANMALNLLWVPIFHLHFQIGHVGLALATASSAFVNAYLLYRGLRRANVYQPNKGWRSFVLVLACASVVMATFLVISRWYLPPFGQLAWWWRVFNLGLLCSLGFGIYLVVLWLGGWRFHHLKPLTSI